MDWRAWLALGSSLAVVAGLLAASTVPGLLSATGSRLFPQGNPGENPGDVQDSTPELQALAGLLEGHLGAEALQFMERLMPNMLPGEAAAQHTGQKPHSLGDLLGLAGGDSFERLPLPTASGPEPLLQALVDYLHATGAEIPEAQALSLAIAGLQVDSGVEASLARLVMAYTQALRMHDEAMQDLTPLERRLVQGDAGAAAEWIAGHPEPAHLTETLADLVHGKVRQDILLQAGDLLARTVEAERVVLGNALKPDAGHTPSTGVDAASEPLPSAGSQTAQSLAAWQALRIYLEAIVPQGTSASIPASPASDSLDAALRGLVSAYGLPDSTLPGAPPTLPRSLELALAQLVDAQAAGVRSGDPTVQADLLLVAAERIEPTLHAWGALLGMPPAASQTDASGVLMALLANNVSPAGAVSAAQGSPRPVPAEVPSLPVLLEAEGFSHQMARQAADSLPLQVQVALAHLLAARAAVKEAAANLASDLPTAQQATLADTPAILELLKRDYWTPEEAEQVRFWAMAIQALDPGRVASLHQAQTNAMQAVQTAVAALTTLPTSEPAQEEPLADAPSADLPVGLTPPSAPGVPPAQRSSPGLPLSLPVTCPAASMFSDCSRDIFLALDVAGGILVTGPGSSQLDATIINGHAPQISIDLGGDDEFRFQAGTATAAQPFGVHIDMGGNDLYQSTGLAQGAARGTGTVGILWDMAGNDRYVVDVSGQEGFAQGFGGDGGLGVLIDGDGSDLYSAPGALAQGVGLAPQIPGGLAIASGLLLDLGEGQDSYTAMAGQGHTAGTATVGVLVDQRGASSYTVLAPSQASQGGRAAGTAGGPGGASGALQSIGGAAGGFSLLLDLGGAGDSYTSPPFARSGLDVLGGTMYLRAPDGEARKQDDSLWLDWGRGRALGIDSTLEDADGDGVPSLVELLAGSDPASAGDTPVQAAQRAPFTVPGALADAIQALLTDGDGDGFPDRVETLAGSDPGDSNSTPASALQSGLLVDLPVLCPASSETACDGALTCPTSMGDSCISLLSVGGTEPTTYTRRAILQVDLGGDDRYLAPVATMNSFWIAPAVPLPPTVREAVPTSVDGNEVPGPVRDNVPATPIPQTVSTGGISIDLSGNDHYGSATAKQTQGYAERGAAILLDFLGNDIYEAAEAAQASSKGNDGVALLIDFAGDDTYTAGPASQAYATGVPSTEQGFSSSSSSRAALVDLAGHDRYQFESQAKVAGSPLEGHALLLDAGGSDIYNSTAIAVDPLGPSEAFPATLFETQGAVRLDPTAGGRAFSGVFADLGPAIDRYFTLGPGGIFLDVSARKDGIGVVANRVVSPGVNSYATAYFIDGGSLTDDSDGDGFTNLMEALAGTDPNDGGERPVTPDPGAPTIVQLTPDGGLLGTPGPLGTLRLPGLVIGGRGPNEYTEYVPFIIDLGGDDSYLAPSIGGTSAMYHAVGRANGVQPGSVALLLDIGGGDDTYHPADCIVDTEIVDGDVSTRASHALTGDPGNSRLEGTAERPFTSCPSLGGAATGIAILADDGGRNDFLSRTWVNASVESASDRSLHVRAWGTTQGASLFGGVGILATWNATNRFQAEVHIVASEIDPVPSPTADAIGLAQGAAWGSGVGILAAFGTKDDEYRVVTSAKAHRDDGLDGGLAEDLAQGAARGGQGVLIDEGGNNSFSAPNGFAQGFAAPLDRTYTTAEALQHSAYDGRLANPVVGFLWSGPGDDSYLGNVASQGSAGSGVATVQGQATVRSLAILLDGGGNDVYALAAAPAAHRYRQAVCPTTGPSDCAFSQGVGRNQGTGLLLDLAGDDRYEAAKRSRVQGAAFGADASGLDIDLGGNDVRRASAMAQAYAEGGKALLADLAGRDAYFLLDLGQAYAPLGTAVFLDTGGDDRYDYGGQKFPTSLAVVAAPDHGNNWTWTGRQGAGPTSEFAADAETLEEALGAYRSAMKALGQPPREAGQVTMDLSASADWTERIDDGDVAWGILHLRANATPDPGFQVQRADFLLDGALLGVGHPIGAPGPGGARSFELTWDTSTPAGDPSRVAVPDGPHNLTATAFFTPLQAANAPGSQSFAASPDGIRMQSATTRVLLDNPPVAKGTLTTDALAGLGRNAISPALGHLAKLNVSVSADAAFPPGEWHADDSRPGARFTVVLRDVTKSGASAIHPAVEQYVYNGTAADLILNGRCIVLQKDVACPDGSYAVNTTVTDAGGQVAWLPEFPLLIDGTPPVSTVQMPVLPAWAGLGSKVGFSGVGARWQVNDDPLALGTANVAGVAGPLGRVTVFRLDASGLIIESQQFGGGATSYPFQDPPVGTGDVVRILTVATDGLGNAESPCKPPTEAAPCFLYKAGQPGAVADIGIDFSAPTMTDLRISRSAVQPATDVTISAVVADEAPGLAVQLRLAGVSVAGVKDPTLPLTLGPDGRYGKTVRFDPPSAPQEAPFAYTVTAADRAGNQAAQSGTGLLDSQPPIMEGVAVSYTFEGRQAPLGRPGSHAFVSLNVTDHELTALTAGVPFEDGTEVPCSLDAGIRWRCQVVVPETAENGDYPLVLKATDAAGNVRLLTTTLVVAGEPPRILDAAAVATGPGSVRVTWNTSALATDHVWFGLIPLRLDSEAGACIAGPAASATDCWQDASTQHEVEVTGLQAGTKYFFQPASRGLSNVANETGPILEATTASGYGLNATGLDEHVVWAGLQSVTVAVESFVGQGPVQVTLSLRDTGNRTQQVGSFTGLGENTVPVNTRTFPDGVYALVLDGRRQADKQQIVSHAFRIDNTPPVLVAGSPRPGLTSSEVRPFVELAVDDPFNPAAPEMSTLVALIDGSPFTPEEPTYTPSGSQHRLKFRLPAVLPSGDHNLTVRLTDAAGNVGEAQWSFTVDASLPLLQGVPRIAYLPGPAQAAPGGRFTVDLNATDPSGVANVTIDLAAAGGGTIALFAHGGTAWNGTFEVPAGAPAGRLALPILAGDALGNAGQIGKVEILVDRDAPRILSSSVTLLNLTAASLAITVDEPTTLKARVAGRPILTDDHTSKRHDVVVAGLRPGRANLVSLEATDGAGHVTSWSVAVTPAADTEPPTAPESLVATSTLEGVVELSWKPASDNAGIDHYEVVRKEPAGAFPLPLAKGSMLRDDRAPAGQNVTYEVSAVDVAGLRGPPAKAPVHVLAVPHIIATSISPASGPSDRPFQVEVTYRHAAGLRPDSITLRYDALTFQLLPVGEGDCRTGCQYAAEVRLPALSVLRAEATATFHVQTGDQSTEAHVPAPLVRAGAQDGVAAGSHPASLPGLLAAALGIVAAAFARRLRRDPP